MTSAIRAARGSTGSLVLLIVAALAWPAVRLAAQAISVSVAGDVMKVHAPALGFLTGEPLVRLKDGRAVRIELALTVLAAQGRSPVAERRRIFALSYDLWEERFAVSVGAPAQSASHLTQIAAEAWCIDQLTVPVSALGAFGRDRPFWIQLEYRILDRDAAPEADAGEGLTLQGLIEALSRRRRAEPPARSVEAGPFRLPARAARLSPR